MAAEHQVGDNYNDWRPPVFTCGPMDGDLERRILHHEKLRGMNINTAVWDEYCRTVNVVLQPILQGMKKFANREFPGLIIHDYVRQGSAREGLKVIDALEFDCLLMFEIEGMEFTQCSVSKPYSEEELIGLIKLRVNNASHLPRRYPWLDQLDILNDNGSYECFLNTKQLQERVLKSLLDRTRSIINDQLFARDSDYYPIRRSASPPAFATRISIDREPSYISDMFSNIIMESRNQSLTTLRGMPTLDIDIVPALLLHRDSVPDPYTVRSKFVREMDCPVIAVLKWAKNIRESHRTLDHQYLWRESTSGYEKQVFDIARRNQSQRYLMTACRIVKAYVSWLKTYRPNTNQLHRVAVSYFLKHICIHCIALLTVPSNKNTLSGVKEALGYFLCFLELCIENKNLPHFFFGNPLVTSLFPNCSFEHKLKKNLYENVNWDTFGQAERSFQQMLQDLNGMYVEFTNLDEDRIGLFKELLGLPHTYRKPVIQQRLSTMCCKCSVYLIFAVVIVALAILIHSQTLDS